MKHDLYIVEISHDFEQPIPALQVAEALNEELGNDQVVGDTNETVRFTVVRANEKITEPGAFRRGPDDPITYP